MNKRPELSLALLHAFVPVAEELHFGRAAKRLNIAQPPLSQSIQRLEAVIGHQLLERDTRKVRLTPAGEALLPIARRLLDESAAGLEKVRRVARGEAGLLIMGFTPTTALQVLPAIVHACRERLPELELQLIELLPDPMSDMLHAGGIDVGLGRELAADRDMQALTLTEESYVAVLPISHPQAGSTESIDLKDLSETDFIFYPTDRTSGNNAKVIEMCVSRGFVPRVVQEAPGWQTAVSLVGAGLGATVLPACAQSLALPGVVYRPITGSAVSRIALLHRIGDERPILLQFLACARSAVASVDALPPAQVAV